MDWPRSQAFRLSSLRIGAVLQLVKDPDVLRNVCMGRLSLISLAIRLNWLQLPSFVVAQHSEGLYELSTLTRSIRLTCVLPKSGN